MYVNIGGILENKKFKHTYRYVLHVEAKDRKYLNFAAVIFCGKRILDS
jgi:hypothetical protein